LFIIAEGQVVLERFTLAGSRRGPVAVGVRGRSQLFGGWSTLLGEPQRLMLSAICRKPFRFKLESQDDDSAKFDDLRLALQQMGRERGRLIPMLQRVQEALTCLPPAAIELVAEHRQISAAAGNSPNSLGSPALLIEPALTAAPASPPVR
jgi:hypothetical protein